MSTINIPRVRADIYNLRDYAGVNLTPPQSRVWNAAVAYSEKNPLYTFTNMQLSPDSNYLIQQASYVAENSDITQWTKEAGDTGTYSQSVDAKTGKTILTQTTTTSSVISDITYNLAHGEDNYGGAFMLQMTKGRPTGAPGGSFGMNINLNDNFRIQIIPGVPIRLQYNATGDGDPAHFVVVDQLNQESEAYLDQYNRNLQIDILPLTDSSYYSADPQIQVMSSPPPNTVYININNADVLIWKSDQGTFAQDTVKIYSVGGSFSVEYFKHQFVPTCSFLTSPNITALNAPTFQTSSPGDGGYTVDATAYIPYPVGGDITDFENVLVIDANIVDEQPNSWQCYVNTLGCNIDVATGFAQSTFVVNYVMLDWESTWSGPTGAAPIAQLYSHGLDIGDNVACITAAHVSYNLDRPNLFITSNAQLKLLNNSGEFSPGGIFTGNKLAHIFMDNGDGEYVPVFLGMLDIVNPDNAARWTVEGKQNYAYINFIDRLQHGFGQNATQMDVAAAFDGQSFPYCMSYLLQRLWVKPDQIFGIPAEGRNSYSNSWHLPSGTTFDPLYQALPYEAIGDWVLRLKKMAAALSPDGSGILTPYVIFSDCNGAIQISNLPSGYITAFQNGTWYGTPSYIFETNNLNDSMRSFRNDLAITMDLGNLRSYIYLNGPNPSDGTPNRAFANRVPAIDGTGDPNTPGYLGGQKPLIIVDKMLSSQADVDQALTVAESQVAFPGFKCSFSSFGQTHNIGSNGVSVPGPLLPLSVIGLIHPISLGTDAYVPFVVCSNTIVYDSNGGESPDMISTITGQQYGSL